MNNRYKQEAGHRRWSEDPRLRLSLIARYVLGLCFALTLTACANTTSLLAPPPNLYTFETGADYPAADVPEVLRRTRTEILFMTNRRPKRDRSGAVVDYGTRRSDQLAFGVGLVEYGNLDTWEQLVARTVEENPRRATRLQRVYLEEFARFPATPLPFAAGRGRLQTTPETENTYEAKIARVQKEVSTRLRMTGLNRVTVYVHGVNNEFQDAMGTLANLWHYTGRQSLPVMFSWPAGAGGPLAYFRDVEAGEFSVFHAKEFLRLLAGVPELEAIDIVAHSRGSVVMTTALRELLIEARVRGGDVQAQMKTGILVLAAADLDLGVARQRLVAERFAEGFEQLNIYVNPGDGALQLSRIIGRVSRLGGVNPSRLSDKERADLASARNVNLIIVEEGGTELGHAYFRENPAVLSDIVLALRTRAAAGTSFRPMEPLGENIFALHQDYPAEDLPELPDLSERDR